MSTTRRISVLIVLGTLVVFALVMFVPTIAQAQCGDSESSCVKCHQAQHPVYSTTGWHSEYGHRYACWNCHGGNDQAQDKASAHVGLVQNPLEDAYASCYACHPENYRQLAEQFATTLGVTVSARVPTPRPVVNNVSYPMIIPAADSSATPQTSSNWVGLLWLLPVPIVGLLVWLIWAKRTR